MENEHGRRQIFSTHALGRDELGRSAGYFDTRQADFLLIPRRAVARRTADDASLDDDSPKFYQPHTPQCVSLCMRSRSEELQHEKWQTVVRIWVAWNFRYIPRFPITQQARGVCKMFRHPVPAV